VSLDVAKLDKARELAGGIVQARCPACAEGGHDRTGEHLRIYPDGKFGCCVHPKDGEHRKRIFALVGRKGHPRSAGTFTLRIKTPPALPTGKSVMAALATPGKQPLIDSRTPRTGSSELRTRAREDCSTGNIDTGDFHGELKDLESGVRAARTAVQPTVEAEPVVAGERLPYLTAGGTLVIPHDSPERYHWWKGGQSVKETMAEVLAREVVCR
jgi:hypothetical protein